jgi:hypothetical protein
MPLVDWSQNTPVVNPGFRYYWAVAIPLTLVVLLLWTVLTHKHYWKHIPRVWNRAKSTDYDIEKASMGHSD